MSTRIGIKREGAILSATQREGEGGPFYDIIIRMTSYGSKNPYVASPEVRGDRWERGAAWGARWGGPQCCF